jgi:hypothetical protein
MDQKTVSYLALVVAGFSAVVSIGSLVSINKAVPKFSAEKDRRLELEARVAAIDRKTEEVQAATMNEVASRFSDLCTALKIDCGENAASANAQAPTVPDEFLARVGTPKPQGADRIEVAVPGDVTAAILSNIEVLQGEVDVEPAARNNRPDGFRITRLRENGLGPKLGLKPGDVIRAVNDMPFTSTEEIVAVFEALEDGRAASIELDLRRDGKELTLVVEDPKRQPVIVPVNP